jgi:tetratricopeptide (TPR) repeat protein
LPRHDGITSPQQASTVALLYERMDLFDEAIATYHAALDCDPNYFKALFNVARLYQMQGEHGNAIRSFDRVLELDPKNAQAHNNLGLIYEEMGRWQEAVTAFQKSAELDMSLLEVHLNLARSLYHQHSGHLSSDLVQPLIERLQMALCLAPDDEAGQPIRHSIDTFLDFLASTR